MPFKVFPEEKREILGNFDAENALALFTLYQLFAFVLFAAHSLNCDQFYFLFWFLYFTFLNILNI